MSVFEFREMIESMVPVWLPFVAFGVAGIVLFVYSLRD